jgi:alkylated DNA repair dioxygenase AlkB
VSALAQHEARHYVFCRRTGRAHVWQAVRRDTFTGESISVPALAKQRDLFETVDELPEGMRYTPELITPEEEPALVGELSRQPFKEFEFHGFLGKRRTVSYGWHYDFTSGGLKKAADMPAFLLPLRERAAASAGLSPSALQHALLIEYAPGAGIGWHRDRPQFGDVLGVSLLAPCTFRLRRKCGATWQRRSIIAAPRSSYLLRGPSRTEWEHSIPPLATLRYSITFRTLAHRASPR